MVDSGVKAILEEFRRKKIAADEAVKAAADAADHANVLLTEARQALAAYDSKAPLRNILVKASLKFLKGLLNTMESCKEGSELSDDQNNLCGLLRDHVKSQQSAVDWTNKSQNPWKIDWHWTLSREHGHMLLQTLRLKAIACPVAMTEFKDFIAWLEDVTDPWVMLLPIVELWAIPHGDRVEWERLARRKKALEARFE